MFHATTIVLGALTLAAHQTFAQCPPITTTVTASGGAAIASSGTKVVATAFQTASVYDCGEAFISASGIAQLRGGTATLSGSTSTSALFPGFTQTSYSMAFAQVTSGSIPTATLANIDVASDQSIRVGPSASVANMRVRQDACGVFDVGGTSIGVSAILPGATAVARSGNNGNAFASGAYAEARATFTSFPTGGGYNSAYATGSGTVSMSATSVIATATALGVVYGTGDRIICTADTGGVCSVSGFNNQARAGPSGTVYLDGTAGTMLVQSDGYGQVTGSNTATFSNGGKGSVESAAQAYIMSGDGLGMNVLLQSGATGYLELGARAAGDSGATMTVSAPGTTVTSIGEYGPFTIYEARAAGPSLVRRRAAAPQVTCGPYMSDCPMLRGGTKCVDVKQDVFNCGGCALDGKGVDCTTLEMGGDMTCVQGRCVSA